MDCTKVKYANEVFAKQDIERIRKTSTRKTIPIRAYLCYCGSWHLTSKDLPTVTRLKSVLDENNQLRAEIKLLKSQEQRQININKAITNLNKRLTERDKLIKSLRLSNNDLIAKNIQLQKTSKPNTQ